MQKQNNPHTNALFILRQSLGLEPKQVAKLLGQESVKKFSRYENGGRSPGLKNAIKLSLIYDATLIEMFPDLVEAYRKEIEKTISQRNFIFQYPKRIKVLENISCCSFENRLTPDSTDDAKDVANMHARNVFKKLSLI